MLTYGLSFPLPPPELLPPNKDDPVKVTLGAAGAGVGGLTGAIGGGALVTVGPIAGFFGFAAFLTAAFLLGAALFRAVFFFAAFFRGADFRAAFLATFLRAVFLRETLAFVFTRAFLDFAAFFLVPARFFIAFLAAIFIPPVGLACVYVESESQIAGDSKLSRGFRQARFASTSPISCPAPTSRHRPAGWCR